MHLRLIVFFMGVAPVYLNKEDQEPHEDNKISNHRLCPNNKVLIEALRHLKENLIDDRNSNFSPEKFKQILDNTILYLNSEYGSGNSTDKNHTSHFKAIGENFNYREKKEALRSNAQFGVPSETLKGSIGLQYELPIINTPDCATLFKAIVNAINEAYLQLNKFCLESGKCYVQSDNILHPKDVQRPMPSIFPQIKILPPPNQLPNQPNIIDFLGSYPQNGDVMNLLQNYRPNTGNVVKSNFLSVSTNNLANAQSSGQGNSFNHIQEGKVINDNQNPDPLTILQSFRPKYIESIKNYGLPIPQEALQINSVGLQENGNIWTLLQHFKPNESVVVKENLSNSGHLISQHATANNGDINGGGNDLTQDQGLLEFQTVLNQPTGYMSVPTTQYIIPQPNSIFKIQNYKFLERPNYTAPTTYFTPQFNIKPIYNNRDKIEVNKNISELTANIPWDNTLRLNSNVQNFPDNDIDRNLPFQSGLNVPYIEQSMGGVPNYQGNGFNIKPPMNIQTGIYYPNAHVPPVSQNGEKYLNPNYYNQIKQYYPSAPYSPNLNLPTLNTFKEKPVSNPQFLNWYQNQKVLQNPYHNRSMTNIPGNMLSVNQLPYYSQTGAPISYSTFANHNHPNIPKELNDLYRLTMTNGAKLNIAPNKNGIVELTFTLQRPQSFVKPLYYVKYRLPYQTYMYNIQNILQKRPALRNDPTKLYQELLEVANMSESSQDLKHLAKEEISKLVVTNGALVKAKVIDESGDKNETIEDDIKSILASNLNPEGMLNASKMALDQVEEAINTTVSKTIKPNEVNETSELPVKVLNTRSIRYPFYPLYTSPYVPPININGAYNIGVRPYITKNKVILAPNPLG